MYKILYLCYPDNDGAFSFSVPVCLKRKKEVQVCIFVLWKALLNVFQFQNVSHHWFPTRGESKFSHFSLWINNGSPHTGKKESYLGHSLTFLNGKFILGDPTLVIQAFWIIITKVWKFPSNWMANGQIKDHFISDSRGYKECVAYCPQMSLRHKIVSSLQKQEMVISLTKKDKWNVFMGK